VDGILCQASKLTSVWFCRPPSRRYAAVLRAKDRRRLPKRPQTFSLMARSARARSPRSSSTSGRYSKSHTSRQRGHHPATTCEAANCPSGNSYRRVTEPRFQGCTKSQPEHRYSIVPAKIHAVMSFCRRFCRTPPAHTAETWVTIQPVT
jgi:hypothetical protein